MPDYNRYLSTFPDTKRQTLITTKRDLFDILVKGYNHIIPNLFISIKGITKKTNKKVIREPTTYKLNNGLINSHINLLKNKDKYLDKIDTSIFSLLGIIKPIKVTSQNDPLNEGIQHYDNNCYMFSENPAFDKLILECKLNNNIFDRMYDDKHKDKIKEQKKDIKKLIDMDILTPKERKQLNENSNKSVDEIKKEYEKERKRLYRLKMKDQKIIKIDDL